MSYEYLAYLCLLLSLFQMLGNLSLSICIEGIYPSSCIVKDIETKENERANHIIKENSLRCAFFSFLVVHLFNKYFPSWLYNIQCAKKAKLYSSLSPSFHF